MLLASPGSLLELHIGRGGSPHTYRNPSEGPATCIWLEGTAFLMILMQRAIQCQRHSSPTVPVLSVTATYAHQLRAGEVDSMKFLTQYPCYINTTLINREYIKKSLIQLENTEDRSRQTFDGRKL